jgi:hypothetical protein
MPNKPPAELQREIAELIARSDELIKQIEELKRAAIAMASKPRSSLRLRRRRAREHAINEDMVMSGGFGAVSFGLAMPQLLTVVLAALLLFSIVKLRH